MNRIHGIWNGKLSMVTTLYLPNVLKKIFKNNYPCKVRLVLRK